jgi:hypothetical protein
MTWPPRIGDPLPRGEDVWCESAKLTEWVLGEKGHAEEWRRVFHVGAGEEGLIWKSIARTVPGAPINGVRGVGIAASYGVLVTLAINGRLAPVLTVWHYAGKGAAPRLVTAYPKLYTRRNGDYG